MPFDATTRDGVLTLTLDTPGSAVNIFNHATARQLTQILAGVSAASTRAIVFETAKPASFLNGVGLLLAQATRTHADVVRASTPPWTAYRAVREAPVPTIAVVQGSCFGCGVEFALNCRYRVASDSAETRFYMTELNDYLFIPLFGSTWNLPETVGLEHAIDLLLWGARWDAATAHAHGLVDEVVPHEELPERRERIVERVLAGTQPSRRRGRVVWGGGEMAALARARDRIASLPAAYRAVYTDALELLETGARQCGSFLAHREDELRRSGASALAPIGKAAYAFFYLRQMASERATGRVRGTDVPITFEADLDGDQGARELVTDLRRRKVPGVIFAQAPDADFRLVSGGCPTPQSGGATTVAVHVSPGQRPAADVAVYAPTHRAGGRLVELASGSGIDREVTRRLARTLQRFGFEVASTRPGDRFLADSLLVAYLGPLLRSVELGERPGALNGALRDLGFVKLPGELITALDRPALAATLGPLPLDVGRALATLTTTACSGGARDALVIDALCVSLLDAILSARTRHAVADPTVPDLIARELLDFPRHLCSLATWLKVDRVAHALAREAAIAPLVGDTALAAARAFVATGRELYR